MQPFHLNPVSWASHFINGQGRTRDRSHVYMRTLSQWVPTFPVSPEFHLFSLKRGFLLHILLSHKDLLTPKCEGETHSSLHNVCPRSDTVAPRIFKPPDEQTIPRSHREVHYVFSSLQGRGPAEQDGESAAINWESWIVNILSTMFPAQGSWWNYWRK